MSEESNQFRSMAFGGFNRQDVLTYLTTSESEHEATLLQVRTDAEKWQQEAVEEKQRREELESKLVEAEKRVMNLQESLAKTETDRDKKAEALKETEEEATRLRRELAELAPKALAYEKIKERAATIELDAHERAQSTLDEAKQEAVRLQQDYVRWMREAQVKYELLRTGLNEAFTRSTVELEQICRMFDRISGDFEGYEKLMQHLLEQADALTEDESSDYNAVSL